jgi:hypothetical protein
MTKSPSATRSRCAIAYRTATAPVVAGDSARLPRTGVVLDHPHGSRLLPFLLLQLAAHASFVCASASTELAEAPGWLVRLASGGTRLAKVPPAHVGTARDTFLGVAFGAVGWLGRGVDHGKATVRCPWAQEHTDGRGRGDDTSTVLFPGTARSSLGSFKCSHGHCAGRSVDDVLLRLPPMAIDAAASAFPLAYRIVVRRLARQTLRRAAR